MRNKQIAEFLIAGADRAAIPAHWQAPAFEMAANALVITDVLGTVLWANPAFAQLTGYSQVEIAGQNIGILKSERNSRSLYQKMWKTILDGGTWRGELINRRKDGSLYDEELTIIPLRGGKGEITHFFANKLDISGRRQAEASAELKAARPSMVASEAKIGVWEWDRASNTFTWDSTTFEIYGFTPIVPLPYEKWAAAVHPDDLPAVEAVLRKAINEKGLGSAEFRIVWEDGSVRNVSAMGRAILGASGEVTRVCGVAQDITERKYLELAIQQEKDFSHSLVDSLPGLFYLIGEQGQILRRNTALGAVSGYSAEEISSMSVLDFFKEPDRSRVAEGVQQALKAGDAFVEASLFAKDQTETPYLFSGKRLLFDGQLCLVGLGINITWRKKMEENLRRLAAIVESSDDAIISETLDGTIETWNGGAERMYEYSAAEAIGKPINILVPRGEVDEIPSILEKVSRGEVVTHYETLRANKSGKQIHIDLAVSPVNDEMGRIVGASTIARDITERVKSEEKMRLWSRVLDQSAEGIFICDPRERILMVNSAFEQLTGYTADEVVGKTPRILQSGRQDRAFYANMWKSLSETGTWRGEMWNRRKSGEIYVEWLSVSAVPDAKGAVTHYVAIFSDITVRKQAEDRMIYLAHYDALTDLPNRVLLTDRLNQITKLAQRDKSKVAVIFIDLDRFKEVNDSLGHDAGDRLLQILAGRLSAGVRAEDTVARMGGDEFVVVFQGIHDKKDVAFLAQKLFSCFAEPVTLNGYEHTVTASMGISVYPDDAANGQELIRNSDAAMYQAKGAGRNAYQFYTTDLSERALKMLSLENALRRAIDRQEFLLYYQPQIDISSGLIVGAEALIRWNHPELGLLLPGEFISIVEERGLITAVGNWVIEEAARQAALWGESEIMSFPIAVNVSAVQFRQKDFVERFVNTMRSHAIGANRIEIELTERIVMRDAEATVEKLKKLHETGCWLSIDDFGTGYSSLSYLRKFPIDKIKIDQSFVSDVTRDEGARCIVAAVIGLARSLNLKVIAEGVETSEQLEVLRAHGCKQAQGFLFSPALTADDFSRLAHRWKSAGMELRNYVTTS